MEDLIGIALRISFTYLYILALLRLSGKRSIHNITAQDFLVALIVGDMFDNIFWAQAPLSQGVVGLATIVLLHTLVSAAEAHSTWIHRLVNGSAVQVVDHAAIRPEGMRKERTSDEELWSQLRGAGEDDLAEVREAYWETKGQISVLPTEAADVARKQDLKEVKKLVAQRQARP